MRKILASLFIITVFISCSKKQEDGIVLPENAIESIESLKFHSWYFLSEGKIEEVSLPQNAPLVPEKPWTEAVRISSAAGAVDVSKSSPYEVYALVNRRGIIGFTKTEPQIFGDESLFPNDTADGLVFSSGLPVFYFYRSSFFFDETKKRNVQIQQSRPFLVEFDNVTKNFYPLVTYENLQLDKKDQITGYFWDGKTWICCAKKNDADLVEFKYFSWEPPLELSDINPALGGETFFIKYSNESVYLELSLPKLFDKAPDELKKLLSSLPKEFGFYISWRDRTGTSPVSYFNQGGSNTTLNAKAAVFPCAGLSAAVFADGTVYVLKDGEESSSAFRLPRLPAGFTYGDFAVAGKYLYVSWEENDFYLTKRAGFIKADLSKIL